MHIVSKVFYLLLSLFLAIPVYSQMPMAPGQFKPQDIDAILNSMTEDDFNNILNELSKMSPQELEELEKIGRQVLLDSGIDPDTGKELEKKAPEPLEKPTEAPAPAKPVEQKVVIKVQNPENVAHIIDTIIKQINMLRQKAQGNDQLARRLAQWAEPLNDLIFYLKVINKKTHHERLATKDFDALFKDLESLSRQLVNYQPHIILAEKGVDKDDPYKMLGLSYDATSEGITAQYTKLKKKHNPKKIKKRLKAENATKKEIDREVRAAELTLSLIQDAYDQLSDPKTKKLVDDKRLTQPTDQLSSATQSNLTKVLEAISNSVYQKKLLDQLQEFLKKYEPEQLAQKKEFEEAQTLRKKEQVEAAKMQPKLTYGKFERTDYPQQLQAPSKYEGFGRGGWPSMPSPTAPTAPTPVPLAPVKKEGEKEGKAGGAGGAGGAEAGKKPLTEEEKRDEERKNLVKAIEKQEEEKKKKETAKKQQDVQEELMKLKAEKEAREKLEGKKEGKPAPEKEEIPTKKRPRIEISDRELIDNIRSNLVHLKKEMRKDSSRKLFKQMEYRGGADQLISVNHIKELSDQLLLDDLTESLNALYDNLPEDTKIQRVVRREWEILTQEYSDTLSCLLKHLKEEKKKYTHATPKKEMPQELQNLMETANGTFLTFNDLSKVIIDRLTLSTEVECDEFLPSATAEKR
jgi:curved DNA-binding protein CbpA